MSSFSPRAETSSFSRHQSHHPERVNISEPIQLFSLPKLKHLETIQNQNKNDPERIEITYIVKQIIEKH